MFPVCVDSMSVVLIQKIAYAVKKLVKDYKGILSLPSHRMGHQMVRSVS